MPALPAARSPGDHVGRWLCDTMERRLIYRSAYYNALLLAANLELLQKPDYFKTQNPAVLKWIGQRGSRHPGKDRCDVRMHEAVLRLHGKPGRGLMGQKEPPEGIAFDTPNDYYMVNHVKGFDNHVSNLHWMLNSVHAAYHKMALPTPNSLHKERHTRNKQRKQTPRR